MVQQELRLIPTVRHKEPETTKLAIKSRLKGKCSIKDLIYAILKENPNTWYLESDLVTALIRKYERMASGSSVSRYLRWLAEETKDKTGKVIIPAKIESRQVVINGEKKAWKEWRVK